MKKLSFSIAMAVMPTLAFAQAPTAQSAKPVEIDPKAIVATINGKKMTADEVKNMVAATPQQYLRSFRENPAQFMREYAWYQSLMTAAEKAGLDKQTPYREQLEFQKMLLLSQAQHQEANSSVIITVDDEKKHYAENTEKYRESQAKLIYIPFSTDAAAGKDKKTLSEAAAKAKAELLVKQARAGADFVKLVKENSEDPGSVAQNGDIGMGVRASTTSIPEPMRNAVLALKVGAISDPVRHENGFYIFRSESSAVLPYEKVREEIHKELKQAGFNAWVKKTQAEASSQINNEEFFKQLGNTIPTQ